jgi:hypothetical protein
MATGIPVTNAPASTAPLPAATSSVESASASAGPLTSLRISPSSPLELLPNDDKPLPRYTSYPTAATTTCSA